MESLVRRVQQWSEEMPEHMALAFKTEHVTYQRLYQKLLQIAQRLLDMGIKPRDRVCLLAVSKPEMIATYLGIQRIGAVTVFVDKNATSETAAFLYEDTGASLFISDKALKGYEDTVRMVSLRELYEEESPTVSLPEISPNAEDITEIIYTSGTTGKPKGVVLTYNAVFHIWNNTIEGTPIQREDTVLIPLPLNHSFALRVLRATLALGASVVLQNGFTFAKEIENNLDRYHCSGIAIVPASVETIRKQMQGKFAEVMRRFRYIEVSAGSLNIEQRKRLVKELPDTKLCNTWGSSESGGALFLDVNEVVRVGKHIGALGKPLPWIQIKAIAEDGSPVAGDAAHPGRMALKGEMQMTGYWNRPEITAETIQAGWLLTGDLIYQEDGYVYMLGRADDIINVGGEKVSPIEVENIAAEYPKLQECACMGVPDPEGILGQVPAMFYVAKGMEVALEELKAFLRGRLEKYKVPQVYIQVPALPRNAMQKLDRKAIKQLWEARGEVSLMNPVMQAILTRRSIRKFQDKPVPKEILEMLVMAGYYAPSGHNMQTWKFTVLQNQENIERLKEVTVATSKANNVYCYGFENPAAIIIISNDSRNQDGCQDASCAAENIMLAAHSYGIGSVWLNALMKLRQEEPARSLLTEYHIPENHTIWCMVALGYPCAEGTLLAKKTNVVEWF